MVSGDTALLYAVRRGLVAPLRMLIEAGHDVSASNDDGLNALHLAARHGRVAALGLLLYVGADVGVIDTQGRTALHWAEQVDALLW